MESTWTCVTCGVTKPVSEYLPRPEIKRGHRPDCRDCHREKTRLAVRRMRERDPERALQKNRDWREANPEKEKKRHRRYDEAHREKRRLAISKSREDNPEHHRALRRKWRQANLEAARERCRTYWHRKRAQRSDDSLLVDWYAEQIRTMPCEYCGSEENITVDHVVPISKGGAHSIENIVPACQPCNSSKGAKPLEEWLGTHKQS